MKCAWRNFIVTMVNAVVDSKCQYERSEIVAHFESQAVLIRQWADRCPVACGGVVHYSAENRRLLQ
jgi:hypothetical protein